MLPSLQRVEFMDVPIDLFPYNTAAKHLVIRFNRPRLQAPQNMDLQPQPLRRKPTILESLDIDDGDSHLMGIQFAVECVRGCQALDISRLTRLHISIERKEACGEQIHINELLKLCGGSLQVFKFTPSRHGTCHGWPSKILNYLSISFFFASK
jgi:hypothetical protein